MAKSDATIVNAGGRGSGKSFALLLDLLDHCRDGSARPLVLRESWAGLQELGDEFHALAAAAFALIGFPLDDIWHRIFGQDVTLWGPTHLVLFGAAVALVARRLDRIVDTLHFAPSRDPGRSSGLAGQRQPGISIPAQTITLPEHY